MKNVFSLLVLFVCLVGLSPQNDAQAQTMYEQQLLIDHFTHQNCGACSAYNPTFFNNVAAHEERIAVMSSQTSFYGLTTIYAENQAAHDARTDLYNVNGQPRVSLNGQNLTSVASTSAAVIENALNAIDAGSPYKVAINETMTGNNINIEVTVTPSMTTIDSDARIFIGLIEDLNFNTPPGSNGETFFHSVLRTLLPDVNGTPLNAMGMPTMVNATYTLPSFVDAAELRTIVVVQNNSTREVLQTFNPPGATGTNTGVETAAIVPTTRVLLKAYLEGPYNASTGMMNTALQSYLPTSQPYNSMPWNYNGNESFDMTPPANSVDWVLVEARDAAGNTIEQQAALLKNNGMLMETDGTDGVVFNALTDNESYYFVIRHRNHLAVLSRAPVLVPNSEVFDFSIAGNVSGTNQVAAVGNNTHALYAGDIDNNGVATVIDFVDYAAQTGNLNTYLQGDCDLNGSVTINDFNLYKNNASVIGIDEIRY